MDWNFVSFWHKVLPAAHESWEKRRTELLTQSMVAIGVVGFIDHMGDGLLYMFKYVLLIDLSDHVIWVGLHCILWSVMIRYF